METHLHDKLNGTDEETEKLENQVLLLLLHLVETVLAAAGHNLGLGETNPAVSLEHVLGDNASSAGLDLLLLFLMAILGLEILDQGIHILIFFVVVRGTLGGSGVMMRHLSSLLVEAASLDVGVQRRSADSLLVSHGWKE